MLSNALPLPTAPIHSHRYSSPIHLTGRLSLYFLLLLLYRLFVPHTKRDRLPAKVEELCVCK